MKHASLSAMLAILAMPAMPAMLVTIVMLTRPAAAQIDQTPPADPDAEAQVGHTEITTWPHGKDAAVSLTWDDGSANQFRAAAPIMDSLGFPATFFIVTGQIPGSRYDGRFIGRPIEDIIEETAFVPTNRSNIFERASAVGYLGFRGTQEYHTRAGALYESGDTLEAYRLIDEAYERVRMGEFPRNDPEQEDDGAGDRVTWDDIRRLAAKGHEFASHTVTHPRLAVLDEVNMIYELEKSREEILEKLGPMHTFSFEGPYGTEDERAVAYALERYPATRNRMPEPFLDELNRWNRRNPVSDADAEYVQWQRGPLSATPLEEMKSWIDTIAGGDNVWLVLVFHGVDGVGWEAKPSAELREYFEYIKSKEDRIWVATFKDVTKYIRERMHAELDVSRDNGAMTVELRHDLDASLYDLPLTLKTQAPSDWTAVRVTQDGREQRVNAVGTDNEHHILYDAVPNGSPVTLVRLDD
jgi:peptidoglycan/xylan/chitin deacetylase (PgdA/CDA1 family)